MSSNLQDFLSPNSIAIIGASKDPTKRGFRSIQTLLTETYPGQIFPINPKEKEILGLTCFPDLASVPHRIDLALVCTPAHTLPGVLNHCGEKGVKGAVILAGGFGEAGEEGQKLERETVEVARQYGLRLVGPNTSGIFNTHKSLNLVGFSDLRKGSLGILTQSGNMALSLVTEGFHNGHVGFSTYIGVGNEADIQFHEYLEYFGDDEHTQAVIAYVEGLKQGKAFLETARRVTQKKPVVLYKSGRTAAGQHAAKSHTGALAGDYAVSRDLMRQAGITVANQSDELLALAETLALLPTPASNRVAVLADGGGYATIAADALTERGLQLPVLSDETQQKLKAILPPAAALANPVDVAGGTDSNPEVFADCARAILQDENVDALLIIGLFGGYKLRFSATLEALENQTAARLGNLIDEFGKPVILQSLYAPLRPEALVILRQAGVPLHHSIETAVQCMTALTDYGHAKRRNQARLESGTASALPASREILATCHQEQRSSLLEHEAKELLKAYGISIPPYVLARTPEDLAQAGQQLGDVPLAMKVVSKDILHKSDAGGVKLNIRGEAGMKAAFAEILANSRAYAPDADIQGMLVAPMAEKGVEIIIGVTRDPQFGPIMMFGLGGIFVEVLKDVVFRALPLSPADAEEMLDEIKAKAILAGVRGASPADRRAIIDLMLRLSRICLAHPEIAEVDLNPVIVYPKGLAILDARMILAD